MNRIFAWRATLLYLLVLWSAAASAEYRIGVYYYPGWSAGFGGPYLEPTKGRGFDLIERVGATFGTSQR